MTNYDSIKNMEKEKMVEFFYDLFSCEYSCPARSDCYENCKKAITDWLDKESEQ